MKKILLLILLGTLAACSNSPGYQVYGVVGKIDGANLIKACLEGVEYYLYDRGIAPVFSRYNLRVVVCDGQGPEKRK